MAFTLEGVYEQETNNGVVDRIEIQQDSGAGRNLQLEADASRNGFQWRLSEITSDSDDGLINPLANKIQEGKLTFYPRIDTTAKETLLNDIIDSPDSDFRIVWKQKPVGGSYSTKWTGNVDNKKRTYPETGGSYFAVVRANDFDLLKTTDYALDDTRQTLITTIADLLGNLSFGLNIRTATSWITEDTTDSTDFLQQIYHETKALREFARTQEESDQTISVWDALVHVGDPALLFRQVNGEFTVEQLSEFDDPTTVHETLYNADGTVNTATTTVDRTLDADKSIDSGDLVVKNDSQNDRYPAIRRAEVRWNHRTKVSRVDQKTFDLDDSTNTSGSVSDVIISDGDQTLDFGIVAGGSRSGSLSESILRYSIFMAGYWWDQSDYSWVPDSGTEVKNEVDLTNTTNKPTLTLWIGGESYETDNIPADADGIMTIKAYIPTGLEQANVTVFLDITNPQAIENSKFVEYKITQQDGYSTDFQLNDTWFGDGPLAYSVSALRYGTGDGDITQDSWQRRGTTTGYRNFHENLLKEILDLQRSNVRKLNANFWGSYDPSKILVYDSENFYCAGVSYTGHLGRWSANLFRINLQTASTDDYDDIPRFREDDETGTSSTEETSTTTGLSTTEGDARYFRQSQAFDELATADIDTALTNLGLKDGSRDLDLNSLDINGTNLFPDNDPQTLGTGDSVTHLDGTFTGDLRGNTLRTDTGKFLAPTSYQFRNAGDTGFRDVELNGLTAHGNLFIDPNGQAIWFNFDGGSTERIVLSAGSDALGTTTGLMGSLSFDPADEEWDFTNGRVRASDRFTGAGGDFVAHENGNTYINTDGQGLVFNSDSSSRIAYEFRRGSVGDTGTTGRLWTLSLLDNDDLRWQPNNATGNALFDSPIHATGNVQHPDFTSGWAGTNWQFTTGGDGEVQNLRVRGALRVYEFIAKQLSSIGGTEILSIANAKIQSVDTVNNIITVDNVSGTARTPFKVDDLWIVQVVDINNDLESGGTGSIVYRVRGTVTNTAATDGTLNGDQIEVSVDAGSPDGLSALEEQDLIVAYGSTSDANRQAIMYRNVDRSEDNLIMRVQTGITQFSDLQNTANTKVAFGDINGYGPFSSETFGFFARDNFYVELDSGGMNLGKNVGPSNEDGIHIDSDDYWYSNGIGSVGNGILNWNAGTPEVNLANWTASGNTFSSTQSGREVTLDSSRPRIRAIDNNNSMLADMGRGSFWNGASQNVFGFVLVDDFSNNDPHMQFTRDLDTGTLTAKVAGAFFDSSGLWAGGSATSDPATKSDSNFWAKFDTGELFYDALVITVWARDTIAGFGAGSTADSLQDDEWTAQRASSTAGDNVIENKIKARYRHRFGINNMLLNYLIRVESSGDGTGTGAVYLRVRNQAGTSVASGNIDVGPTGTTEDTLEVDVSSLNVGQYYTVEVDLEAQVGNVNSGTVTITSHLREDAIIYATT